VNIPFVSQLPKPADLRKKISSWPVLTKLFGRRSIPAIGLDVGSAAVRGVKLIAEAGKLRLVQLECLSLTPNADPAQRTQVIHQVFQKLDHRDAWVTTAVGGLWTVLRSVLLPKMTPQEVRASLAFEAEKYIPFKMDETFLDFAILGDRPGGKMEVFLAAAHKELVNAHLAMLKSAGVTVHAVDLEALALANAWEGSWPVGATGSRVSQEGGPAQGIPGPADQGHPDKKESSNDKEVIGLIHVGARGTVLNLFLEEKLQFTRWIPVGGQIFTRAIADGLQLDVSEAETLKCQPGARQSEIRTILDPYWENWLSQCRVSFDFYEDQFGQRVNRLLLAGGSALLTDFKEWIQKTTGIPVEEWNPLAGLTVEVDRKWAESQKVGLGVTLGLAVRELR
jgi:type IV pilus assembly protein PilM